MNEIYSLLITYCVYCCAATAGVIERKSIDRAKYKNALDEYHLYAEDSDHDKNIAENQDIKCCIQGSGY